MYVINTCCVTAESEAKSRKLIRRARGQNPDALVAVTGCYAEMDAEMEQELEAVAQKGESAL